MHAGRAMASSTVTISQGDRLCARSLVLLSADEPDFIRHADPAPDAGKPEDGDRRAGAGGAWEVRIVGDVDISDPTHVGPPDLDVWTRFVGAPDDPAIDQALLAFATDGFLIGTAMRPHDGVGQSQAHVTLSTGVLSHTLTFHEPAPAADWLLLSHHSPTPATAAATAGPTSSEPTATLVASFVQDAMIRPEATRAPASCSRGNGWGTTWSGSVHPSIEVRGRWTDADDGEVRWTAAHAPDGEPRWRSSRSLARWRPAVKGRRRPPRSPCGRTAAPTATTRAIRSPTSARPICGSRSAAPSGR